MLEMKRSTLLAFIRRGALWGMFIGLLAGLINALPELRYAFPSVRALAFTAAPYILGSIISGALLGGLLGGFLAFMTALTTGHPASKFNQPGGMDMYRGVMVFVTLLIIFIVISSSIPMRPWLSYGWFDAWVGGLLPSAVMGIAGGFITYQLTGWYLKEEYGKKKKGLPPTSVSPESHGSLDETLAKLEGERLRGRKNDDGDNRLQ